jgi:hypothetical protein
MKNKQQGFITTLLIIIISLLIVGGGTYIYFQNKLAKENTANQLNVQNNNSEPVNSESSNINTTDNSSASTIQVSTTTTAKNDDKNITDAEVVAALNAYLLSPKNYPDTYKTNSKFEYQIEQNSQGKKNYTVTVHESQSTSVNSVLGIYKGDLNNDGYDDAFVWTNSCPDTDSSCGYGYAVVINKKDGTGDSILEKTPSVLSGWSGGNETKLEDVKIQDGIIYITSSTFKDSSDYKLANNLPKQTKKFKLQGNDLVEVK